MRRLFEPLGYTVTAAPHMLDEQHPDWGASPYFTVTLEGNCRLRDLLTHLYVLIPVLDDDKHYFIGDEEDEKLLRHGKGWLENHPEKEQVAYRYLKHKRDLAMDAIHRLVAEDNPAQEGTETRPSRKFWAWTFPIAPWNWRRADCTWSACSPNKKSASP